MDLLDNSRRNFLKYPTPPSKEQTCLRSRGMGILINADAFSAFRHTGGRNGVDQKVSTRGPQAGL